MAKLSEKYELMYIIDAGISEEETEALIERFNSLIEEHGTIDEHEDMGVRKLAYEIDYKTEGHYVLTKFTSGPSSPRSSHAFWEFRIRFFATLSQSDPSKEEGYA